MTFAPLFFFFNDTATTEIYTLSLHDALPIRIDAAGNVNSETIAPVTAPPSMAHVTCSLAEGRRMRPGITAWDLRCRVGWTPGYRVTTTATGACPWARSRTPGSAAGRARWQRRATTSIGSPPAGAEGPSRQLASAPPARAGRRFP